MRRLPLLALLAALASCGGHAPKHAAAPRLVILYATCTLNERFLAVENPAVRYTPALERFAREGLVFRRHVTECGQSGVDFATLFTGTPASAHGIYDHPNVLPERNQLVAESFAAAGYETFFWSGHPMASTQLGYGQGVPDAYQIHRERFFGDTTKPLDKGYLERLSANDGEMQNLLARLEREPDYRAFVQIAFTVTHEPYTRYVPEDAVQAFVERFPEVAPGIARDDLARWLALYGEHRQELNWDLGAARAALALDDAEVTALARSIETAYAACVNQLDCFFGRFLGALEEHGLADEALVAFTADHGELLYRDNATFPWTHGLDLAQEILDVPWILRGPGIRPGVCEQVTRSLDVFPTLAGLCGVPIPDSVRGTDLSRAVHGDEPAPELLAFSHTPLWPESQIERFALHARVHEQLPRRDPTLMSVRVRARDLVVQVRWQPPWERIEAFDLASDPEQRIDVYRADDPEHARLLQALRQYKEELVAGFEHAVGSSLPSDEELERLRSLGYAR